MFNNTRVVKSVVILPVETADIDDRPGAALAIRVAWKSVTLAVSAAVNEGRRGGPDGFAGEPAYLSPGRGAEGAGNA